MNIKGFDLDKVTVCTILYEGTLEEVNMQEAIVKRITGLTNGLAAGEENGIRGYFLTYIIAYIRDTTMNHYFVAESFETAVPWSKLHALCTKV